MRPSIHANNCSILRQRVACSWGRPTFHSLVWGVSGKLKMNIGGYRPHIPPLLRRLIPGSNPCLCHLITVSGLAMIKTSISRLDEIFGMDRSFSVAFTGEPPRYSREELPER